MEHNPSLAKVSGNLVKFLFFAQKQFLYLIFVLLAALALPAVAAPGDGHWDRQFAMPGTGTRNYAMNFKGNRLYTAGYSVIAGQIDTNTFINVFDGTNWSILGQFSGGIGTLLIEDFAFVGGNVYVGGLFSNADGVPAVGLAKWDGNTWSDVGGFKGFAFSLATDNTNLYVGGSFTNVGGVLNTNLAKWNGTSWSAVGVGVGYYDTFASVIHKVAWRSGQIYIGGTFTNAGSSAVTNFARWDGVTWSQIGGAVGASGDDVTSFDFLGSDIYVAGKFATAGGVPALNIAKWNGSTWSALGAGLKGSPSSTPVNALAFLNSNLYACGNFTNAGGLTAGRMAKWDGSSWSTPGSINGAGIRALSNSGSIYVCGDFNLASNVIGDHIIRYDGANWFGVTAKPAQGTHTFVQALSLASDGLYMGGFFSVVGNTPAACMARWNGSNWNTLGSGITGSYSGNAVIVRAVKARNSEVFVGGAFVNAGAVTANNIARWNGSGWSALGFGVDFSVSAIDTSSTKVYVGGSFTNAYNSPGNGFLVNRIAMWDAANGWLPMGSGVSGSVSAISVANNVVYVGGAFTTAGGLTANRIAMWDGVNWSSLGTGTANGLGGSVTALLADGTDLYVGGSFTTAGTVTARGIAKWNGTAWSALGQGLFYNGTASVNALAKMGSYLYVGGTFTNAGGSAVTRAIARWDGTQWETVGSGVGGDQISPRVNALAVWNDDLFVGGIFETAGLTDSGYIARWNDQIDFTPTPVMRLTTPQKLAANTFKFSATATPGTTYAIDSSPDLVAWTPFATNSAFLLNVTNTAPGVNVRSYRMREIP